MISVGEYYVTPGGGPFWNMAFDEWLFDRVRRREDLSRAFLRLYSWASPAVTIGYNQDLSRVVDLTLLDDEIPVIRRVTGGRAIHHDPTELTFSLILDIAILSESRQSLSKTNGQISRAVTDFLRRMGINATRADRSDLSYLGGLSGHLKSCFGSVSKYEVLAGQNKIAGGAQRRLGSCLIHQGSIKLSGVSDCPAIGQSGSLSTADPPPRSFESRQTGEISAMFAGVFSRRFSIDFQPKRISDRETPQIQFYEDILRENSLSKRRFY
ncbi:MAG: hypothetical protein JSU69_06355 [Candidatus Zixiibacteriota bacterium]|nr:MAG: hypothetical protein JSU69_06355 [candidate division Zixibacteria bacterium]